ncbi:related to RPC37 Pol III transcription [Rhynchosporium agropyri]|uniref:Related to RPC37 Pol III transcription n=1 Tax=Rhynchosporium agropyri TaxID=914238 RepID=A0A1E1JTY8_9HELO|nr:related to RPC37 Pol III transcription [Rhynchosporium agropyri]
MAEVEMEHADAPLGALEEDDPIVSSYDIYIKPQLAGDLQMYVLQFPNRDSRQPYNKMQGSEPLKLRIKPNAGMVELDVPMEVYSNYDRKKGLAWGGAMKKSAESKGNGSHGLPGGFGIGAAPPVGRGKGRGAIVDQEAIQSQILADYQNAVKNERVLVKQTLGGQTMAKDDTTPQYMIGTFSGNQLHLTPVDNIVQMRPQFHHIDAQSEQDRAGRARDPAAGARATPDARAIHMTVKSNVDGEEDTTDTMAARITAAQAEAWKKHRYVDEEHLESWDGYQNLFVGSEKDGMIQEEELKNKPMLRSSLNNAEYLDEISAPMDAAKLSRSQKVKKVKKGKGKEKAMDEPEDGAESDEDAISDPALSDTEDEDEAIVPKA